MSDAYRIYVIEVERLDPSITWDLYVGSTHLTLSEKWQRYQELVPRISRYFRERKVRAARYRYDLLEGWGPYETREEAIAAEGDLALALQQAGHAVHSDRLR